jgi:hypothetical protein
MRRRFVIAAEGLTDEQETEFRTYIKTKGAWWHWIANFWLLTTTDQKLNTAEIRDQLKTLNGDVTTVVFEFPEDVDWATFGKKNASGKEMTEWLKESWAKKD